MAAIFTDVHGPLLETYLGTEKLREGSLRSLKYLKKYLDSPQEPRIVAVVSGDSEYTLQNHFRRVDLEIEYGTVEHGLGIKLRGKVFPIYEFDDYRWLKEPILQLAELRRKLELDMPDIKQAYKQFMVALFVPVNMTAEDFKSYVADRIDGFIDLSKFDSSLSHGAWDVKPKNSGKLIGVKVLKKELGLKTEDVIGVEDNDFEWLEEAGYVCCITPSSHATLNYVKPREKNGTGIILHGDYRNLIIKQVIELSSRM